MVELYGRTLSRLDLARRTGSLAAVAGVRLVTLGDGVERGVRALEFRTGTGLAFDVLIDRAMDIGACEHRGRAVGWQSPTGLRHPGLHETEGRERPRFPAQLLGPARHLRARSRRLQRRGTRAPVPLRARAPA